MHLQKNLMFGDRTQMKMQMIRAGIHWQVQMHWTFHNFNWIRIQMLNIHARIQMHLHWLANLKVMFYPIYQQKHDAFKKIEKCKIYIARISNMLQNLSPLTRPNRSVRKTRQRGCVPVCFASRRRRVLTACCTHTSRCVNSASGSTAEWARTRLSVFIWRWHNFWNYTADSTHFSSRVSVSICVYVCLSATAGALGRLSSCSHAHMTQPVTGRQAVISTLSLKIAIVAVRAASGRACLWSRIY